MNKLLILVAVLTLAFAACGGAEDSAAELPTNDAAASGSAAGACLEGDPDCNDTPAGAPQDLPEPGTDGDPVASMSIADAATASGQVMVTGFLVDVAGESRLCEALAESFPPQCGGASISLTSLDQIDPDELKTEGDVTWTDSVATVFGEMVDGTLVVTPVE
ncbi:MAG: hypothetical protein QNJ75_00105 [Acidimicrobiia bacterium]|nr:hypothetical protein [Acidimicrobiia bacterium]